jgi:dihydroorotate dehydrogenase
MITLRNGYKFSFMVASGAMGFDGHGWSWHKPLRFFKLIDLNKFFVVTKTITRDPEFGNYIKWYKYKDVVRKLGKDGLVNSIGLTNPGIGKWAGDNWQKLQKPDHHIIISLAGKTESDLIEMVKYCAENTLCTGIEINASCSNNSEYVPSFSRLGHWLFEIRNFYPLLPIIVKFGCWQPITDWISNIAPYVDAITFNSVPWNIIYPTEVSPLKDGGAVSGKLAQRFNWPIIRDLVTNGCEIPIIGTDVWEYNDMNKLIRLGVKAISFGSIHWSRPMAPTRYVRKATKDEVINRWMNS